MTDFPINLPKFHRSNWHNVPAVELSMHRLEPLSACHIEPLSAMLTDERFSGFYDGFRETIAKARYALNAVARRGGHFAIVRKSDGVPLGEVTILDEGGEWEIGYWLGVDYRGQGIMSMVMTEFVEWVFCNTEIKELYAECECSNEASAKVLAACGFVRCGGNDRFVRMKRTK